MPLNRRLKKTLNRRRGEGVIDLTAMTDMIFILLIFFILTSNVAQNVFDIELPKADPSYKQTKPLSDVKDVKITIFTNGEFAVGDTKYQNYDAFKKEVKRLYSLNKNTPFVLITEKTLPTENLFTVLTFLKAENITKVDILVKQE
jgi:biopolymer transport protein ExbD